MSDSETRRRRGVEVIAIMAGSEEQGQAAAEALLEKGALGSIALETSAGEIWSRTELSRRDRSLSAIAMLTALGREKELERHISGGLNHGLTMDEIDEIFVQLSAYAGMPVAHAAADIAADVFARREGVAARPSPPSPLEEKTPKQRRADGLDLLKTLLGLPELNTKQAEEQILESQGALGELVIDYAFGDVWTRPQLSRRDRSLVVISALTALNIFHELEIHLQGALNHGVTPEEIEEMLVTAVIYVGFPRAIDGMRLARAAFALSSHTNESA